MNIKLQLIQLGRIWTEANGRSLSRLATIVINRGHFFVSLESDGKLTTDTFEKFLRFFRDGANWPDGCIPQGAADLLDNFANIAVEAAASTGQADEMSPDSARECAA